MSQVEAVLLSWNTTAEGRFWQLEIPIWEIFNTIQNKGWPQNVGTPNIFQNPFFEENLFIFVGMLLDILRFI